MILTIHYLESRSGRKSYQISSRIYLHGTVQTGDDSAIGRIRKNRQNIDYDVNVEEVQGAYARVVHPPFFALSAKRKQAVLEKRVANVIDLFYARSKALVDEWGEDDSVMAFADSYVDRHY